jgi:hypothetical protein
MAYRFDQTAFGKEVAEDSLEWPLNIGNVKRLSADE